MAGVLGHEAAQQLGDVAGLGGVAALAVGGLAQPMKTHWAIQNPIGMGKALVGRGHLDGGPCGPDAAIGNGEQSALIEGRIGKTDEGLAAAAVVPGQHGGRQVAGGLGEEAVRVQFEAGFFLGLRFVVVRILAGRKEIGGRKLLPVAHHDGLGRPIERGHRLFRRDLAGLVVDHHIEKTVVERQGVRHAQRTGQPDRLEIGDYLAAVPGGQLPDGAIAHDLGKLMLQFAAAAGVALFPFPFTGRDLRRRQF